MNINNNLIEQAKKELPNYDKLVEKFGKREKEFGEGFEEYFLSQIRREMKKLKMNPVIEKDYFLIGCEIKDWGSIMRNKYGDYYPEGHKRVGEKIPESDITYTYYFFGLNQTIKILISKKNYVNLSGNMVKIKYQEGKSDLIDCQFYKEVAQSNIQFKNIPKISVKEIFEGKIPTSIITNYLENPLIQISNVNVLDVRITGDLGIIKIDDNTSEEGTNYITMFISKEMINFTEDASKLETFGFLSFKAEENQFNLNAISVFVPDKRFLLKEKPKELTESDETGLLFGEE